ncbi:MAG: hypothetical protein RL264_2537 [Bacteroidota bacterium]|jgi:endonuclease I
MKNILYLFLLLSFKSLSQLPAYYSSISTTATGAQLKQQLASLITTTHTTFLTYSPGIWNLLEAADQDINDATKVQLIYGFDDSDASTVNDRTRLISLRQTGSTIEGFWNREHTFAQSLGTPALGTVQAGADGHHLRAADGQMNSIRNNRPFTYGKGNAKTVGTELFFPGDEWKGDIARMMMYMYLRYPTQCLPTAVSNPTITISSFDQMTDILITWHQQDPVSQFEIRRNNTIQQFQGNRNPFIDNPEYATRIWGNAPADSVQNVAMLNPIHYDNFQIHPNPANDHLNITSDLNDWNFMITDYTGKILLSGDKTNSIQLSNLQKGNYLLFIFTSDAVIPKPFVVE